MRAIILNYQGAKEITLPEPDDYRADSALLDAMYSAIGCRMMTGAGYIGEGIEHAVYCDDEGLLTLENGTSIVRASFYPEPLAGNLLITGFNPNTGEDRDCTLTLEEADQLILERAFYFKGAEGNCVVVSKAS